jgi:hypothetical protein
LYETYEHQNQGLVTPKLVSISLVLPKGFNMWALQILALPSLRLKLLESLKNYNVTKKGGVQLTANTIEPQVLHHNQILI